VDIVVPRIVDGHHAPDRLAIAPGNELLVRYARKKRVLRGAQPFLLRHQQRRHPMRVAAIQRLRHAQEDPVLAARDRPYRDSRHVS